MVLPLLGTTFFATPCAADLWIQPDPVRVQSGTTVDIRLYEGSPFGGEELPFKPDDAILFQRLWKGGRVNAINPEGSKPAARFTPDRPGVHMAVYNSAEGDRFCKAFVVVGAAAEGDPLRWSELGQTLEIVPQSDPAILARAGGTLEVQILFDREPLAGARVTAIPEVDSAAGARSKITDEIGVVRFRLDRPGRWMVRVAHRGSCEGCGESAPESFAATLVLAAGP
jgi:hypothetical protein